jgi:plasmid stabilization system protein ParE
VAYTVIIQPTAALDIRRQVTWLTRHASPSAAARWQSRIIAAVHSLASDPERCPLADEAADLGIELRERLSGRRRNVHRILFTIDGDTVNVLTVRHAAQDRLTPDDL